MTSIRFVFLMILTCVAAGCMSNPVEDKAHTPALMVAQNSDGVVSMSWESAVDHVLTSSAASFLTVGRMFSGALLTAVGAL